MIQPAGPIPARLVVVAYAIAALCLLVPLAAIGAGIAAVILMRGDRLAEGCGVVVAAAVCTVVGVLVLR